MNRQEIIADLRRRLTGNGDFNPDTIFPLFRDILRELSPDSPIPAPEDIGTPGFGSALSSENETASDISRAELVEMNEQLGFGGAVMGREIKSLRSKLDLAVKALEPFADRYDYAVKSDANSDGVKVRTEHLRLARSTLTEMRKT